MCMGHHGILVKYGIDPHQVPIICYLCGKEYNYWDLRLISVDHILPRRFNDHSKQNFLPACRKCNHSKNDMTIDELLNWCHKIISRKLILKNLSDKQTD